MDLKTNLYEHFVIPDPKKTVCINRETQPIGVVPSIGTLLFNEKKEKSRIKNKKDCLLISSELCSSTVNEQTNAANIYILPPHIIGTLLFNFIKSDRIDEIVFHCLLISSEPLLSKHRFLPVMAK